MKLFYAFLAGLISLSLETVNAQVDNPYAMAFDTTRDIMYCSTSNYGVFKSTDDGNRWSKWNKGLDTGRILFASALAYVEGQPGKVLASASVSGGATYLMERQSDDTTWRRIETPPGWKWVNSFTVSDSMVWICGDGGLWLCNAEQRTFENRTPPQDTIMTHLTIATSVHDIVWSGSAYLNSGIWNRVSKSTDGGATWTRIMDSTRGLLKGLYIDPTNSNHVIVVNRMFRETFDGGATWPRSTAPDTITAWISKTAVDWENNRWYSATAYDSVYASSDQGITWTSLPLAPGSFISDIILHPKDPCHIFVLKVNGLHESTDCGQTWKRNPFTLSIDNPESLIANFTIESQYPNPVVGSSLSVYHVRVRAEKQSVIQFRIVDVLGRERYEVHEEFYPEVSKVMTIPTSLLEAGTFFLHMDDGRYQKTLPLILLR